MTQPTSAVNPDQQAIAALAHQTDDRPIIMMNLLEFRGPQGRASYARYARVSGDEIRSRGGRVVFAGQRVSAMPMKSYVAWDTAALVYYPRRAAWLDMQTSDTYQAAIPDRTAGLSRRLLYAFKYPDNPSDDIPDVSADSLTDCFLIVFHQQQDAHPLLESIQVSGGQVTMNMTGEQAMVSDHIWQGFILARFDSGVGIENFFSESYLDGAGQSDTVMAFALAK